MAVSKNSKSLYRYLIGGTVLVGFTIILCYGTGVFHVTPKGSDNSNQTKMTIELMQYVRSMADDRHIPREGTFLYEQVKGLRENALCNDYADVLTNMIQGMKLGDARVLDISFNPNRYDMHTLVEYFDERQQEWILIDPTFSMLVKRKADGMYATAANIQQATLNRDWSELEFILPDDRKYDYYLDYPLLFLNLHRDSSKGKEEARSLLPYLEKVSLPVEGIPGWYILQYVGHKGKGTEEKITASVEVNGALQAFIFDGIEQTSKVFGAKLVSIPQREEGRIAAYKPKQFVFSSQR